MAIRKRRFRISRRAVLIAGGTAAFIWLLASAVYWPRHAWQYSLEARGAYEVRDYRELTVAQVRVTGRYPDAVAEALALLDAYLGGDNLRQPVEITTIRGRTTEASHMIRGSGPTFFQESGDLLEVSVVLPEGFSAENAPRPRSPWVRIVTLSERTVAVAPFRGRLSAASFAAERESLTALLERDQGGILSQFRAAQYGPWWAFPLLRRSEIHVTTR